MGHVPVALGAALDLRLAINLGLRVLGAVWGTVLVLLRYVVQGHRHRHLLLRQLSFGTRVHIAPQQLQQRIVKQRATLLLLLHLLRAVLVSPSVAAAVLPALPCAVTPRALILPVLLLPQLLLLLLLSERCGHRVVHHQIRDCALHSTATAERTAGRALHPSRLATIRGILHSLRTLALRCTPSSLPSPRLRPLRLLLLLVVAGIAKTQLHVCVALDARE